MDMRIKTITFFLAIALYVPSFAQLSIEACYRKAQANYPLIKQYGLIAKTEEYNLSNAVSASRDVFGASHLPVGGDGNPYRL